MSIYISGELYISEADDVNANNPIIAYHSILTPSAITATYETAYRTAANMWTPDTSSVWEGNGYAGVLVNFVQYVYLENINNLPIDYVAFARHNLNDTAYQYTLQKSDDAGLSWDDIGSPRIFGSNSPFIHFFDQIYSGKFRIKLEKETISVDAPIIAHIKLGRILVLQRRIYVGHKPVTIAKKVKKITNGSENGQYLGQIITRSYFTSSCRQENNTPEFVRENITPFINHINGDVVIDDSAPATFFFAWRPGDYPDEVIYAWTNDNIEPENQRTNGMMSWGFSMEGVA